MGDTGKFVLGSVIFQEFKNLASLLYSRDWEGQKVLRSNKRYFIFFFFPFMNLLEDNVGKTSIDGLGMERL